MRTDDPSDGEIDVIRTKGDSRGAEDAVAGHREFLLSMETVFPFWEALEVAGQTEPEVSVPKQAGGIAHGGGVKDGASDPDHRRTPGPWTAPKGVELVNDASADSYSWATAERHIGYRGAVLSPETVGTHVSSPGSSRPAEVGNCGPA